MAKRGRMKEMQKPTVRKRNYGRKKTKGPGTTDPHYFENINIETAKKLGADTETLKTLTKRTTPKKKKGGKVRKTIDAIATLSPLGIPGKAALAVYDYYVSVYDDAKTKGIKEKSLRSTKDATKWAQKKVRKNIDKAKQKRNKEHLETLRKWEKEEEVKNYEGPPRIAEYEPSTEEILQENLKIYKDEQSKLPIHLQDEEYRVATEKIKKAEEARKKREEEKYQKELRNPSKKPKFTPYGEPIEGPGYQKGGLTPTYDARSRSKKTNI